MDWVYIIDTFWGPVSVLVTVLGGGFTLWLLSKVPSKTDHDRLSTTVSNLDQRMVVVERHIEDSPTRAELQEDISEIKSDIAGVKSKVDEGFTSLREGDDENRRLIELLLAKSIPGAK